MEIDHVEAPGTRRRDPGPAPDVLVRLEEVGRTFPQGAASLHALRRVTLDIRHGEWLTITGRSGAGKSTLLAVLGLQDAGWAGRYWLAGHAVHDLPLGERARVRGERIGFVFQNHQLLDDLTVRENLEVPLAYRRFSRVEREARVAEALDRFGLAARADLHPRQLSGGQQQLVAVARAVVGHPALLLADEPTGSLHSDQAREVMELFQRLHREGTTIVQVTHAADIAAWSQRTVTLSDGWLEDAEPLTANRETRGQRPTP